MNGTFEIFTNKEWMILPSFVHGILPTVMNNANTHSLLGIDRAKKNPMCINAQGDDIFREYEVTEDGTVLPVYDGWNGIDYLKDLKQPFVNVIPIDGPITRNGGACSYGSKDIRDWMMKASDNPYCQGHVLVVNTPGGSAWAKNDFQQGIDYAHSKGMRVIDFIDGMSASAGEYLASLCDEVYVMNLKDQLGCVGVMASFFTQKSGDKNQYTNETYREYYATKSINKNKEIRDIAENDDATLLIEELDKLEAEFRADMKKAFPNATDEYLDGKMYDANDVIGILVDGQMLLNDAIARAFQLADGSAKPIERTANRKLGKRAKIDRMAAAARNTNMSNINNQSSMKEKFPALFAALAVEEMQMTEEGAFLNAGLLDTLNAAIEAKQQEVADAKALADQLTAEKAELESQLAAKATEMETLNTEHASAIETLNAEHATAIEEKQNAISALEQEKADLVADQTAKAEQIETLNGQLTEKQTELDGAKASLETAQNTIAERDQQISDLNAQITELTTAPGNEPAAGAAPQNNGEGVEQAEVAVTTAYVYDNSLPYEENMKRKKEFDAQK